MIEYLTSEEAAALVIQNDPHFHPRERGCKVERRDDAKTCKTHNVSLCETNKCAWEFSDQGDWHYGRFTPRVKNYRALTPDEVYLIHDSTLPIPDIARHFHIKESVVQRIKAETTYRKLFAESPMELNQNEAITP